ncbi:hypothetical protein CS063_03865 [Sporanaerobium hydrogeniformans]|uniref:Uncharacterized protein n=1 Tax=Sporanaerobium hydrogeniformans TaxID=3072179 RepID=A0AC61DGA1_9FIRM|nr:hypothetical protein [Sporanaerobium hydrogeniformans]PHV71706.1 hypothetical protein CS063_03865 [Sporanaerobium hydrogeniformans]
MKCFRKIYSFVLIGLVVFNMILYLLERLEGISIINDGINIIFKLMVPILTLFFPYLGKKWVAAFILIGKFLVLLSIPYILLMITFFQNESDVKYGYVQSPSHTHEIIIKGSVKGLHNFTQYIEIYEKLGGIFKKNLNTSISVRENKNGEFRKAIFKDGIRLIGQEKYDLGNGYILEWIDENTLEISHSPSAEIKNTVNLSH